MFYTKFLYIVIPICSSYKLYSAKYSHFPPIAFKTESLYIVIPVCLVVLLMLAILITMCLRWRKHVKKVSYVYNLGYAKSEAKITMP